MANRSTQFPDGPRIRAFRAAEVLLREYPPLAEGVKTWSSWDGRGFDKMPTGSGMLPYVQLSPLMIPNEPMGEGRSTAMIGVQIKVAVAGLVAEDLVNLWDAIEDALVRGRTFRETSVLCYFQQFGVYGFRVESPGVDAWQARGESPSEFLQGVGRLVLRVSRPA